MRGSEKVAPRPPAEISNRATRLFVKSGASRLGKLSAGGRGGTFLRPRALVILVLFVASLAHGETPRTLDRQRYLLGFDTEQREWRDWDGRLAYAPSLEVRFQATANDRPACILITQRDVKLKWPVLLNGKRLGFLELEEAPLVASLAVPTGALHDGENTLSILSPNDTDDIEVGPIVLDGGFTVQTPSAPPALITVSVHDAAARAPLPARITVVNDVGERVPILIAVQVLSRADPNHQASPSTRPGVVYTARGQAQFFIRPGKYTVFATRGPEYSLASQKIDVAADGSADAAFTLTRDVPTAGLVSCDTHVHTFTLSKHGDATLDERLITLAAEGIEFPIATDHNVYADYSQSPLLNSLKPYFTWVTGDEVTTSVGHFIAFPVTDRSAPQPNFKLTDWPALMREMRAIPGNQVVVLNHPRDTHNNFVPFAPANFNAVTGDNLRGPEFTFDAIEVCNSGTLQSDFMQSFRDWFALLNHGYRVTAVGSSDSHDVTRFIVGQGRTLITGNDANPGHLDVDELCRNLKAGRAYVSLGLLTRMTVDGKYTVGDLVTGLGEKVKIRVDVLGPSWMQADRVELYANGRKIAERSISESKEPLKGSFDFELPRPAHDLYLVAIASGPGVTAPYWAVPFPYQPTDRIRKPRVIGATNPIYVDGDGDGRFTAPRGYAQALVAKYGPGPEKLVPALAEFDSATAAQAASLCRAAGTDLQSAAFQTALTPASVPVREGFEAFLGAK